MEITFKSTPGNICRIIQEQKGNDIFTSVNWKTKPSLADIHQFDTWYSKQYPNATLISTLQPKEEREKSRQKFLIGELYKDEPQSK